MTEPASPGPAPAGPPAVAVVDRQPVALWAWMSAEICSYLGTRLSMVAVPWLVLTTTGSAVDTGVVAAAELAPYVVAKALSGPLVDRLGSRRVSLVADLASAAAVALVPLLHLQGWLTLPVLIAVVALIGVLRGPGDLAKMSMAPKVSEVSGAPLERVTGLASVVERLASTVGAALAGVVIVALGAANALALTAAALLLSWTSVRWWLPRSIGRAGMSPGVSPAPGSDVVEPGVGPDPSTPATPARPGYWRQLGEGASFLRRDRLLLSIMVMVACTNLLDQAASSVLMPVWVREHGYGADVLGLLFGCFAAAAVGGSAVAAAVGSRLPRLVLYVGCFLIAGAPRYWVLATSESLVGVLATMVVAGAAAGFINPLLGAVMFERIPPAMVGRVTGLFNSSAWALMPFGAVLGGLAVAGWGLDPTLVVVGAGYLVITLAPVLLPSFRAMGRRPHPATDPDRPGVGTAS